MDSAFSITTTTNAIVLDAAGRSAAVFTVNNQTGRSVRVRTDVSAFPPTPPAWFSIDGASERIYPPGGAEAVTVLVAGGAPAPAPVAPGAPAPPGQYVFRLDAVSVDRPDEEWAHGPSVGFEVTAPKPQPPAPPPAVRRGYLETVLGTLAGALLAIVVSVVIGLIVVSIAFPGALVPIILRLYLVGGLTLPCALAGGIGAVVALGVRRIADADPWRTGAAVGVLAAAGLTVLQIVLAKAIPLGTADVGVFALTMVVTLIVVVPAALAGRAYARFRAD